MIKKLFITALITTSLCVMAYAEIVKRVGTYTAAGYTASMPSNGARAVTYQISMASTDSVDTLIVSLEGSLGAATNSGWSSLSAGNDNITIIDPARIDSVFFIRYDGLIPNTRLNIRKFVGHTVKSITVDFLQENK
jgi:hypothetical protein